MAVNWIFVWFRGATTCSAYFQHHCVYPLFSFSYSITNCLSLLVFLKYSILNFNQLGSWLFSYFVVLTQLVLKFLLLHILGNAEIGQLRGFRYTPHIIPFLGFHFISTFIDLIIYLSSFHSISIIVLSLILILTMGVLLLLSVCDIPFSIHNFNMALFSVCRS